MRAYVISNIAAAVFVCAALSFAAPTPAAPQTTASKTTGTTAKPSAAKSAKARVVKKRKPRQKAQTAPTPARISEIQSALGAQGTYKGQPTGRWDDSTIQAMKAFQSGHGLAPTGKLDALSLQKLGLGSEIAGRGAPLSPPQTQGNNPSTLQQAP
jgi:peptidoglycan hydrolase-like protein with peptidoglycan-binding domain